MAMENWYKTYLEYRYRVGGAYTHVVRHKVLNFLLALVTLRTSHLNLTYSHLNTHTLEEHFEALCPCPVNSNPFPPPSTQNVSIRQ